MFVQVIRCTVKAGSWDKVMELDRRWEVEQAPKAPGFKGSYILREKNRPNGCLFVVLFENEELARQNSNRPDTNKWFQMMTELMEGQPEFIDTEIARSYLL